MTLLDGLLLLSLITAVAMAWLGARAWAGWLGAGLYAGQLALLAGLPMPASSAVSFAVLGHTLHWQMGALGWFFALILVAAALLATWYAAGAWRRTYPRRRLLHVTVALNVLAMLILLASGDLLSLFVGWELATWSGYLILTQAGGPAERASLRYLVYTLAGGMAVFAGVVLVDVQVGSLQLADLRAAVPELSAGSLWLLVLLFTAGFGIKMAFVPFHLWQAEAYAETPGPVTAFVSAISARMGLFAMAVVLIQLIGPQHLTALQVPFTFLDAQGLLAWIAAITAIVPTFIALTQSDARMLLAWHGIGQGGYMLLGLMAGSALGAAGGLMHVFNHATYQAGLFLAVAAVIYRTGTSDLDRLGGLISRMPLSFITMLIGIIGLAGLPPTNGFVSKWMIYKALLNGEQPLLFIAAVIATLGTILSVYKLIHNTFLGQLRVEHHAVQEVPWSMRLPMLITALVVMVTGVTPGLVLDAVAPALEAIGLAAPAYHLGGLTTGNGNLDMVWVGGALTFGLAVGLAVFLLGSPSQRTHQWDNYAGGHFLSADIRFHYSHDFYPGLMRALAPAYRGSVRWLEAGLVTLVELAASAFQGLYRAAPLPAYLVVGVVLLLWWIQAS